MKWLIQENWLNQSSSSKKIPIDFDFCSFGSIYTLKITWKTYKATAGEHQALYSFVSKMNLEVDLMDIDSPHTDNANWKFHQNCYSKYFLLSFPSFGNSDEQFQAVTETMCYKRKHVFFPLPFKKYILYGFACFQKQFYLNKCDSIIRYPETQCINIILRKLVFT